MTLAEEIGYPLVAKPADSSGSKGVTLVEAPKTYRRPWSTRSSTPLPADCWSRSSWPGRNLTVDVFIRDGLPAFTGITEKRILPGAHFVIGGHPARHRSTPPCGRSYGSWPAGACPAIGLTDGPANFDVFARLRPGAGAGRQRPAVRQRVPAVDAGSVRCGHGGGSDEPRAGRAIDLTPTRDGAGIIHVLASPPGDRGGAGRGRRAGGGPGHPRGGPVRGLRRTRHGGRPVHRVRSQVRLPVGDRSRCRRPRKRPWRRHWIRCG